MHQTYWFLFTPDPGEDLLAEADYYFTQHYAVDLCDDENWNSPQGIITGDGRQVIVPGEESVFSGLFGENIPTAEELLTCALQKAAELFQLEPQHGDDLHARILQEVPQRLSGLYAKARGGDYCRAQLSEAFELYCDKALKKSEREVEQSRTALKEAERTKGQLEKRLKQLEEAQVTLTQEQEKVFRAAGISAASACAATVRAEPAA